MYRYKAHFYNNGGLSLKDILIVALVIVNVIVAVLSYIFIDVLLKGVIKWVMDKVKICIGWLWF